MAEYQIIVEDDCDVVINTIEETEVVTQVDSSTIVVLPDDSAITTIEQVITVVEGDDGSVIVSDVGIQGPAGAIGPQGPQGPAGDLSEEDVPYATRVDFVGETLIYKGQATPGTADSASTWRIQEITFVGGDEDVEIRWADGVSTYTKVWDDRATYGYS